jgi:hypothetical protein
MAKSKKEVAAIVSALGVLGSIITTVLKAIRQMGGKDEDIYYLAVPEGELLLQEVASLIVNRHKLTTDNAFILLQKDMTRLEGETVAAILRQDSYGAACKRESYERLQSALLTLRSIANS